jgi:hypothetical protein
VALGLAPGLAPELTPEGCRRLGSAGTRRPRATFVGAGDSVRPHRRREFLRPLDHIDRTMPAEFDVHVVIDSYAAHKPAVIRA